MDKPIQRKPRQHFDTATRPMHVTFDDGRSTKRNFPWAHYIEARFDYAEPDLIKVTIGNSLVEIIGHNLAPLYIAIEDHTLTRLRAQPFLEADAENESDTFATRLRFLVAPFPPGPDSQGELDLGVL